ncbi:MAG TPA: hypothetical protein VNZ57_09170, partial [Longimicrobiales bacterium]|nr:hypothetical protein [Longimicrobiales bacterium]
DPVWTLLPHDFSIFLEMLGDLPPLAYARAERSGGDVVGLLAVLEGEFPCVAEVSTRYADKRREIRLHGSDGVAVFPGDEAGEVLVYRGAAGSERPTPERILIGGMTALQHELAAVLAYLRGGPAPASIARDALRIARLVHETRRMAGIER